VQPLVLRQTVYLFDQGSGGYPFSTAPPDWRLLRQQYDAVWAINVPYLAPGLSAIGSASYTAGDLTIYTIRKDRTSAEGQN
jgi:hypothetical protein